MVRRAESVYRHWWRSHAPAASTFEEYRVPSDEDVARAAVRLADNLRHCSCGRCGGFPYPSHKERLAALEWREIVRELGFDGE
jgi:hypothetical protein